MGGRESMESKRGPALLPVTPTPGYPESREREGGREEKAVGGRERLGSMLDARKEK
jgi:hypothetical protein